MLNFDFATREIQKTFANLQSAAQSGWFKNTLDRLSILVTLRCDRVCKFCAYRCGPFRTDPPIKIDLVEKVLKELQELNQKLVDGIHLTGGEATLEPALTCDIIQLAKEYGHKSTLLTNAQFASSFDVASSFLTKLRDCGLDVLALSWDEEHQKGQHVPKKIATTLAAAHELNFDCVFLSSVTAIDNTAAFNRILNYVKDTYNIELNFADKIQAKAIPGGIDLSDVAPYMDRYLAMYQAKDGSPLIRMRSPYKIGHKDFWDVSTPRSRVKEFANANASCLRAPMLYPTGDVHMCTTPEMVGGNLKRESLKDIYSRYENNEVCNLLREGHGEGLVRYIQFVDAFTGSNLFNRNWSCLCELCLYLHQVHLPAVIHTNPGLKCVQEYFPFHETDFDKIELNAPPQNAEAIDALKKTVHIIFAFNTYKTCTDSIRESWEPLVKDPKISAALKTWDKELRAS
jgi:MoaA/NifB/PqqE/SkfB family radical SAM enzyme